MEIKLYIKSVRALSHKAWVALLCTAYIIICIYALKNYIVWRSVSFVLGLVVVSQVMAFKHAGKTLWRCGIAAAVCLTLHLILPVKTLLYATAVFGLFFLAENLGGRISKLVLLAAAFMCPVFNYTVQVFGFPIRLWLSKTAAAIFQMAGAKASAAGNMIVYNGSEFGVDAACSGLNMMEASMLLCLLTVGMYQKKYNTTAGWFKLLLLLFVFAVLNIVANLARIICLVHFNIQPGFIHEVCGLICLLLYGLLPGIFIASRLLKRGRVAAIDIHTKIYIKNPVYVLSLMLLAGFAVRAVQTQQGIAADKLAGLNTSAVTGYKLQILPGQVIQLQDSTSLVYIKPVGGFYSTDHNPAFCWRGSGYSMYSMAVQQIHGRAVYHARLQKGTDILFTAWWYDNGQQQTISQLQWRWNEMRQRRPYALVNITASTAQSLEAAVDRFENRQVMRTLIN